MNIKKPEFKKPSFSKPNLKKPSIKASKPKTPELPPKVDAVVKQLQESRLLIPIALLIVAIIATPLLLARSSEPAPPVVAGSAAAGSAEAGSSELDPVVLAATPGLRDYKERLDGFASKNPFKQQLTDAPKSAGGEDGGGDGGSGDDSSLAGAIADGTTTSGTTAADSLDVPPPDGANDGDPIPVPVPDPDPTPTPDGNGGSGGNGGNDNPDPKPEPADPTKITVRYGPAGNTQLLIDLKPIHEMAGPDDPLARLRRVNANSAVFGISPEVDLAGEGSCLSEQSPCNLLRIKVGQTAELTYRPTGETYRLQLLRVK